jgi:hypothetical protein
MTAFAKLKVTALLVLVLVGLVTGIGWAGVAVTTVRIDDLAEGPPTVTTVLPSSIVPTIISIGPEFVHFTLPSFLTGPLNTAIYTDIFEDKVGGVLSDRLLLTYSANSSFVDVQFASDPATITLPAGAVNFLNVVENGNFQFAANFDIGETTIYQFQVRSDVADVPAPATVLLLGFGLAALAGATWRRRRRAE